MEVHPGDGEKLAKVHTEAKLQKEDTVSLQLRVRVLLSCTHSFLLTLDVKCN